MRAVPSNGNYVAGRVMSSNGVNVVGSDLSPCGVSGADRTLDTRHASGDPNLWRIESIPCRTNRE